MKFKVNHTAGQNMIGELDGVPMTIKVLGNKGDNYVIDINGQKGLMHIVYALGICTFEIDKMEGIDLDPDDGSTSDGGGSSPDTTT